jgi:hypothetical protein
MPITPFLNGERFDPETKRVMGVALEMTCIALRIGDCSDDVKQAIANKIIELAKAGCVSACNFDPLSGVIGVRQTVEQGTRTIDGRGLRPADLCAR